MKWALVLLLALPACASLPVSAVIRNPVDSKCQAYGLKGCPELVDGAIAYVEGNESLAVQKLDAARAKNTPQQLQQFAKVLREVANMTDAARPLADVATILTDGAAPAENAARNHAAPAVMGPPVMEPAVVAPVTTATSTLPIQREQADDRQANAQRLALYALTARDDPTRRIAETVQIADAPGAACEVAGSEALCLRRKQGPVIVTDVVASESCGQQVFLAAADSDTAAFGFIWTLPARAQGIHGGAFNVKGGQWLFVAIKPTKAGANDRGCFLTWSGFQPRLVPAVSAEDLRFNVAR
jgi:hypothetical protein